MELTCSKCSVTKPSTEFHVNNRDSRGYAYNCKVCESSKQKAYYGKTKSSRLSYRRKYLYGVNEEVYQAMLERSGGTCEICNVSCSSGRALSVDHCHKTQEVRGLLCTNCNTALGSFKDSTDLLKSALNYLERK